MVQANYFHIFGVWHRFCLRMESNIIMGVVDRLGIMLSEPPVLHGG